MTLVEYNRIWCSITDVISVIKLILLFLEVRLSVKSIFTDSAGLGKATFIKSRSNLDLVSHFILWFGFLEAWLQNLSIDHL